MEPRLLTEAIHTRGAGADVALAQEPSQILCCTESWRWRRVGALLGGCCRRNDACKFLGATGAVSYLCVGRN